MKNGRNNDGILDGCEDGVELGTLEGFALGAALSGLTSIVILEEQSWQIGTKKQRDKKRNDKIINMKKFNDVGQTKEDKQTPQPRIQKLLASWVLCIIRDECLCLVLTM